MTAKFAGKVPSLPNMPRDFLFWLELVRQGRISDLRAKRYHGYALSSDPDDPAAGSWVLWQSDGTDTGVDGTVIIKSTDTSGNTNTLQLINIYKEIQINPGAVKAPPTKAASYVSYGLDGAWEFSDGTDDTVVLSVNMPFDMDRSFAPEIFLFWGSPTNSGDVVWQVEHLYIKEDGDITASVDATATTTDAASTTNDGLVKSSVSLTVPDSDDKLVAMRIKRLGGDANDTLSDDANLVNMAFRYRSTSRGEAV